jgi:hypothetical protein
MDKSVLKTYLLSVKHYVSDRVYYYQKVKNYAKFVDVLLSGKPVVKGSATKLGMMIISRQIFEIIEFSKGLVS